jgi:putative peptidoglycan lipid II flippase
VGGTQAGRPAARLGLVTAVLAGSVALSRVLGAGREMVLTRVLGAGAEADAYRAAFLLPDLLNYFLAGGALSIAFIPFYTRLWNREGDAAADRFLAVVFGTTGALAIAATAVLWIGAEALVTLQFPKFAPDQAALTAHLTRILLPAQIFFVTGGVLRGALMARGHFVSQSLAPVIYNLAIIAGGVAFGTRIGAEGFAWGALVGAFLGAFGTAWLEIRRVPEIRLFARLDVRDPALRGYLAAALPLVAGVTLGTADDWFGRWFGGLLGAGAIASLGYARQLMLLPVGIVGQSIATAALPTLARHATESRDAELHETLLGALRAGLSLACLAAVASAVFAGPLVRLLYEGGRFTPADSQRVALLLQIYALAVPAWIAQQIAVRGFYARGDTWRPMWIGTAVAAAAAALYLALGRWYGVVGLAYAGVAGMVANALATLVFLRAWYGGPPLGALARTVARAIAIAGIAGAAAWWVPPLAAGRVGAALELAVGGALFGAIALLGIQLAGDAAQRSALHALARRIARLFRR